MLLIAYLQLLGHLSQIPRGIRRNKCKDAYSIESEKLSQEDTG